MKYSVLYNPYAANSQGEVQAKRLESVYPDAVFVYYYLIEAQRPG